MINSKKSKCSGVSFDKSKNKWKSSVSVNGKRINLGTFTSESEAISERKLAECRYGTYIPNQFKRSDLTKEYLKEYFYYNQHTGNLFRIKCAITKLNINKKAGYKHPKGYIYVKINGIGFRAHRVIFLYMTGSIPDQVDHINHVRDDNRWANLRSANNSINQQNTTKKKSNSSGFNGVSWNKKRKLWQSYIQKNKNLVDLGYFSSKQDAINARKEANIKYDFHPNHGL